MGFLGSILMAADTTQAVTQILRNSIPANEELTKKAVRRRLEERFSLDEGALDEHKVSLVPLLRSLYPRYW
jgi:hypothetical protein